MKKTFLVVASVASIAGNAFVVSQHGTCNAMPSKDHFANISPLKFMADSESSQDY